MKSLLGVLFLVGFVCVYWKWVLLAAVVFGVVRGFGPAWREFQGERLVRREAAEALAARADMEHAWAMAGDERGTYGRWPPAC